MCTHPNFPSSSMASLSFSEAVPNFFIRMAVTPIFLVLKRTRSTSTATSIRTMTMPRKMIPPLPAPPPTLGAEDAICNELTVIKPQCLTLKKPTGGQVRNAIQYILSGVSNLTNDVYDLVRIQ